MSPELLITLIGESAVGNGSPPTVYVDELFYTRVRKGTGASATISSPISLSGNWTLLTKRRDTTDAFAVYDSMRGATKELNTNSTAAESTQSQGLTASTASSYTYGTRSLVNASGSDYIDFLFREHPNFFKMASVTMTGTTTNVDLSSLGTIGMAVVKRADGTGDWITTTLVLSSGGLGSMNPSDANADFSFSNGNLTVTKGSQAHGMGRATMSRNSGKWYWEVTINTTGGNSPGIGVANASASTATNSYLGSDANGWSWYAPMSITYNGSGVGYGAACTAGDIIGVAMDLDAGTLEYFKNGTSQGVAFSNLTGTLYPAINLYDANDSATANFGASAFAYGPPSGFVAIGSSKILNLNDTAAATSSTLVYIDGTNLVLSSSLPNGSYSVYAWAHDATATGYIRCGQYETNGSGDASVDLSWEPQFLFSKRFDSTGDSVVQSEMMGLTASGLASTSLAFNSTSAESTSECQPKPTGFILEGGTASAKIVYMAIRRRNTPVSSGTEVFDPYTYVTETAGTTVSAGFQPDVQLVVPRATGNVEFLDRLRGVNSLTTAVTKPYLTVSGGASEGTSSTRSRSWLNSTFEVPSAWASSSTLYWTLRRVKGFLEEIAWKSSGTGYVPVTLNPSDANADFSFSNGDLTVTKNSTFHGICRAAMSKTSGKWYWEVTIGATSSNSPGIGIANASASLANNYYLGSDANSWSWYACMGGSYLYPNGTTSYGTAASVGDVIGVALDLDAGTIAFSRNGTMYGTAFTGISGAIYPAINLYNAGDSCTANFGASAFAYGPPSGYSAMGSTPRLNHGLGAVPEAAIVAMRSGIGSTDLHVYVQALGGNEYLVLNSNAASQTSANIFGTTAPTAIDFGLDEASWTAGDSMMAYLLATVSGVSKIGSYTGNGSSQNIGCGFNGGARGIIIKRTDSTGDWFIWDSARGIVSGNDPHLALNTTSAEVTTDDSIDPHSAGFTVNQNVDTNINVASAEYVFIAIA